MKSSSRKKLCTFEISGEYCSIFLSKRDWEILHDYAGFIEGSQLFLGNIIQKVQLSYRDLAAPLTMILNSTNGSKHLYGYDYSGRTKISSGKRISGINILGMDANFDAAFAGNAFFELYNKSEKIHPYKVGTIDARSFAFSNKELIPDIKITAKENPVFLFTELEKLLDFVKNHMETQEPFVVTECNFETNEF